MRGEREGCQKQQGSGGGAAGRESDLVSIQTVPSTHVSTGANPRPCLGNGNNHPQLPRWL